MVSEYEQQYVELANRLMELIREYNMPYEGLKPGEYDKPIERTLKEQRERIAELEGESNQLQARIMKLEERLLQTQNERNAATQRIKELEAEREIFKLHNAGLASQRDDYYGQVQTLTHELAECRAQNTNMSADIETYRAALAGVALASQSASGQENEVSYQFETISLLDGQRKVVFEITIPPGGKLHSWEVKNDLIHLAWQRPARPESDGSDKIQKAIEMLQDGGDIDGSHHKQWYIDQTLQWLMGKEAYEKWWTEYATEYGGWDEGIAP
jgi:hypothetical protein